MIKAKTVVGVRDLRKTYGRHAVLDGIDLSLDAGSMTAVCGPSGCGKSTLLNIIGLLERPDAGTVELFGATTPRVGSAAAQKVVREHVSYLFQNFALVESDSVEKNLLMALRYVHSSRSSKRDMVARALARVALPDVGSAKVHELSGGEQQRVALARAMVKPGELVLADEPTGSVDAQNRDVIVRILRSMCETGKTVLVVTHDDAVAATCDRVVHMR